MNRRAVERELPDEMRRWLHQHASGRVWNAIARDLAIHVGETLLLHGGEAGVNLVVYNLLSKNRSPAVRELARKAVFSGRRWLEKPTARLVAWFFEVSFEAVYQQLRWRRLRGKNTTSSPSDDSGS